MRLATSRSSAARPASRRNDTGVISNSRSFAFATLSRSFFLFSPKRKPNANAWCILTVQLFHGPTGDRGHLPAKGSLASPRERTSGSDAARARQRRCRVVRPLFFSSRAGQTPLPVSQKCNFVIVKSHHAELRVETSRQTSRQTKRAQRRSLRQTTPFRSCSSEDSGPNLLDDRRLHAITSPRRGRRARTPPRRRRRRSAAPRRARRRRRRLPRSSS